jgi:hypothetical protein
VSSFEPERLRAGELLAGAGGLALLVAMIVPWYDGLHLSVRLGSFYFPHTSQDAWNAFTVLDVYLAIVALSALWLLYAQATRRSPALPVSLGVVVTVMAAVAALLVLWRILDPPGLRLGRPLPAFIADHLSRRVLAGPWLGLAACIAIAAGGWRSLRREGVAPRDERTEIETVMLPSRSHAGPAGSAR